MARTKDQKKEASSVWKSKDPWVMVRRTQIVKMQNKVNKTAAQDLAKVAELMNRFTREENKVYMDRQDRYRAWVREAKQVALHQETEMATAMTSLRAHEAEIARLRAELDVANTNIGTVRANANVLADALLRVRKFRDTNLTKEEGQTCALYMSTPFENDSGEETESDIEVDYEELLMAINPRA